MDKQAWIKEQKEIALRLLANLTVDGSKLLDKDEYREMDHAINEVINLLDVI